MWIQKQLILPPFARGFHLITDHIIQQLPELERIDMGLLHLFLQHTSASIGLNENADPTVRADLESSCQTIAPEVVGLYQHDYEGPDDMPAHLKSALFGVSLSLPIKRGRPALGTWQGIILGEHRNQGGQRRLLATIHGQVDAST